MPNWNVHPDVSLNAVECSVDEADRLQAAYERGDLIALEGVRIAADFDFLSRIPVPAPDDKRKKYFLTHPSHYAMDRDRSDVWQYFRDVVFAADRNGFAHFQEQVREVNVQILDLAERAFPMYPKQSCPIVWKFQAVQGENLHIDNIDGCDRAARLRVFVNLSNSERVWGLGEHLRHYAGRHFESAGLHRHAGSAYRFNQALTLAAFGSSLDDCSDRYPRHVIRFRPGEVWLVNSTVVAHQVQRGDLLAVGSFVFPYSAYRNAREALPRLVADICRERMGAVRYATTAICNRVIRRVRRERN